MGMKLSHGTAVPNVVITKGMRLAAARKHANITQEKMGEMLGCSRRTIIRYEGEGAVSAAVVMAYSFATDVNLAWLETGIADFDSAVDHFDWATSGNEETPAEAGVSGLSQHSVRHKGLEPLTFWLGDIDAEYELLCVVESVTL